METIHLVPETQALTRPNGPAPGPSPTRVRESAPAPRLYQWPHAGPYPIPPGVTPDQAEYYPLREDLIEVENADHSEQTGYLQQGFPVVNPRWGVYRSVGIYFEEGNREVFVVPDVLVLEEPYFTAGPPEEGGGEGGTTQRDRTADKVIRSWLCDPPLLSVEVISPSNTREEMASKKRRMGERVHVQEYLEIHAERREMTLEERVAVQFRPIAPDGEGRYWSRVLPLGFQMDESGFVWIVKPDGARVLLHHQDSTRADAAEAAVQQERELRAQAEAQLARLQTELQALLAERAAVAPPAPQASVDPDPD